MRRGEASGANGMWSSSETNCGGGVVNDHWSSHFTTSSPRAARYLAPSLRLLRRVERRWWEEGQKPSKG